MSAKHTEIVCIIDKSGSMDSIRSDAIGGFNSFLKEQKKHPDKAAMTLVLFNHEYHLIHNGTDLKIIEPLDESTIDPTVPLPFWMPSAEPSTISKHVLLP